MSRSSASKRATSTSTSSSPASSAPTSHASTSDGKPQSNKTSSTKLPSGNGSSQSQAADSPGLSCVSASPSGVRVQVHVQPGASNDAVQGMVDGALKLRISAPPVFLDPISRGLPGGIRGPEDVPQ